MTARWSIEASREAPLSPSVVFALYLDPTTWSAWGHSVRWARARGPVAEMATVDVKARYGKVYPVLVTRLVPERLLEIEVRPPAMLVINRYAVEPVEGGSRIRHEIEVSGRLAGITRAFGFDRLYTRLLRKEIAALIEMAASRRA